MTPSPNHRRSLGSFSFPHTGIYPIAYWKPVIHFWIFSLAHLHTQLIIKSFWFPFIVKVWPLHRVPTITTLISATITFHLYYCSCSWSPTFYYLCSQQPKKSFKKVNYISSFCQAPWRGPSHRSKITIILIYPSLPYFICLPNTKTT